LPLSNITTSQLYEAIARIGPAQAAEEGYFHALPYGEGGGTPAVSNVRMLKQSNVQTGDIGQALIVFSSLGFTTPLTQAPFLQTTILNPVAGYAYNAVPYEVDLGSQSITVRVQWAWMGAGDDPLTGGNFDIGLRVEPFVLSV
jgi:hypothetical protein